MSLSLTTGGLSKKPGQVCDSGVNLLPNNKGLVAAHLKRRQGAVCMQREDDVMFVSRLFLMQSYIPWLYISLLHIIYIALFIFSQSFGVIVFSLF